MNDPTFEDRPLPTDIGAPARRALNAAGIVRLAQLADVSEGEVAALHGIGPKALRVLREALAEARRAFAPSRADGADPVGFDPVVPNVVDAYLERFDGAARAALEELRGLLLDAVPGATETMAYGIPTLDLDGRHVIHFAGFARHLGLYPAPSGMAAFEADLARYVRGKGSVRFPLDEPLPRDLIRRIAAFRVAEVVGAEVPPRAGDGGEPRMDLGAFSIGLAVENLERSTAFYEKLGFTPMGGAPDRGWSILANGDAVIGLFEGMFEKNILTFNPGWDRAARPLASFTDVRDLQRRLERQGVAFAAKADPSGTGPARFVIEDPDGNAILVDQHV